MKLNKVKDFWEKLNYWQKGTIIGFLVGILLTSIIKILEYYSLGPSGIPSNPVQSIVMFFFYFLDLIGKFFFLELFGFCEFGGDPLCETSLPYFMIIITSIFFGFIVGLILFIINKNYLLNKMPRVKYLILLGVIMISLFSVMGFILSFPNSGQPLDFIVLIYLINTSLFILYCFTLGGVYDFMKKKNWWNTGGKIIYSIISLTLFIMVWVFINVSMFVAEGPGA